MNRRDAVLGLLALGAVPLYAFAQQQVKLPVIGFLNAGSPSGTRNWVDAFLGRLHDLGWTEGQNVRIEHRSAEGSTERSAQIISEFVRLKVDIIFTYGTAAVLMAKHATSSIPIVFAAAADPVGNGIVASLGRPGGNVTGMSIQQTDSAGKRLELLRKFVPNLRRLAVIGYVGSAGAMRELHEVQSIARTLGVQASYLEIHNTDDIAPTIQKFKDHAEALFVVADPMIFTNRAQVIASALGARLATICNYREYVQSGCLMSYGPNYVILWRRAADFVDKILRGTKPSEIPVEQPTNFDLVVNLKTAKALGLTIPKELLVRADEVIE